MSDTMANFFWGAYREDTLPTRLSSSVERIW